MIDKPQTGLKRDTIDKFYTKNKIVKDCINQIKENIKLQESDLVIEPSAGGGAFIEEIKKISNNYLFYDIEPEHVDIIKQDFLKIDYNKLQLKYTNIHIIGNPPFGRQSSSAIKFIKLCCKFSKSICFILPKSFKKQSLKKHFDIYFHLIFEKDLDEKSFTLNNTDADVPCIFQIWIKKYTPREKIKKEVEKNFKFVKKENKPHISFRRVGVNAGAISIDIENKSIQSHYFISFTNNKSIHDNLELLKKIKFETNNTVGPKSISKYELIQEFNKLLI